MGVGGIAVAVDAGLAPIYIVWMDGSLTQIKIKQQRQGLEPTGTMMRERSCEAIATAFGARGVDVRTVSELAEHLKKALVSDLPTVIGVHVNQEPSAAWFDTLRG
jgi:acetolactate synthase-1/2/3 large subunit